mmetsp:Transcript_65878/g.176519  ORF Transcript_65878/g.176519 Transcript_65878/m.176519 type:complete len:104 (+) Transcript_65878:293-604(+)
MGGLKVCWSFCISRGKSTLFTPVENGSRVSSSVLLLTDLGELATGADRAALKEGFIARVEVMCFHVLPRQISRTVFSLILYLEAIHEALSVWELFGESANLQA